MVLEKRLFRVPRTTRRSNQSVLKEINTEYSLEGRVLKLKLQFFAKRPLTGKDPCHSLLQGIFLTQELNPSLLHCRQILYLWSHASQIQKKRTMSFSLWITLGWGILKDIRQSHWHQRDFENDHRNQMKANPESLGWRGAFSSSSSCKEMWNFLTSCHNVFKKPFSKWTNYPGRITH